MPDLQPDLHLNKGSVWSGNDIYNDDGADQKAFRGGPSGEPMLFRARLENDGAEKDHFYLQCPAGDEDWTVQYYQGLEVKARKEVTAEVTSPEGWKRPNVPPGGFRKFLIVVTPRSGLDAGARYVALVRVTAHRDANQRDTLKMVTRVKAE